MSARSGIMSRMGIFSGLAADLSRSNVTPLRRAAQRAPISPWQTGSLSPIIASDIWGLQAAPVTALDLLRVPAVSKGRAVIHSLLSRPLRAYGQDGAVLPDRAQPTWLYRTNSRSGVGPKTRTRLILDDFIFHDATLLECELGVTLTDSPNRRNILDAWHVDYDHWVANDDGTIDIDRGDGFKPVENQDTLIWIPGPSAGLLSIGAVTARGSQRMAKAWVDRVENPFPLVELHETEDTQMSDDEIADWLTATMEARKASNGAFFIPYNIEATSHAGETMDLFESGRNAERIDWANYLALPAAILDGSLSTASLTYSTQEGTRNEMFDYMVEYWLGTLTDRLSLDDIVPAGTSIDMDFSDLLSPTASPSGPREQD